MTKLLALLFVVACAFVLPSQAFAPSARIPTATGITTAGMRPVTKVYLNIGEQERDRLTRDTEPQDFFATNTDKMSDAEKLPIAIAGIAFITLPFLAGLIALYAAK